MYSLRFFLVCAFIGLLSNVYAQQDVDFHLNAHLLQGKNILKVKRDFKDPYLWVLAQNNEVYRINSLTNVVDNYTSVFSAYIGFQFIDIAGITKDLVFIGTNSTNLIEYKNGNFKKVGSAEGITGVINSIGVDYTGSYITDNTSGLAYRYQANTLLIGTNTGMCHFDYDFDRILPGSSHVPAKVFETTYRSEMFSNLEYGSYSNFDVVEQYPVISITSQTVYGGWLWMDNNTYGHNINTAYYTNGVVIDNYFGYSPASFMNLYWGTENGLFQNNRGYSYSTMWPHKQYLNGIKINKITSILGLTAFGTSQNQGLIKENLLVGTPQGLYFSTSGYWNFSLGTLNNYTFFHYDLLGNKTINDICINATSYSTPVCEDGVWVAANDGLYLLKPDYTPYVNDAQQIQAIQFNGQPYNTTDLQICTGSSAKAELNQYAYGGNAVQWYKDGVELPAESSKILTIVNSGEYYAVLYDPCSNIHVQTNHLKVSVTSAPVFTFNYPDKIEQCAGSSVELKADAGNTTYQYRWYKDGSLNGNTTNLQNVTLNGKYKVEVSACQGNWVPTKEVQVDFTDLPQPAITANKPAYCVGEQAQLTINTAVNANYTINWFRNGNILPNSTNQTALTTATAGDYTVSLSANNIPCLRSSVGYPLVFNAMPVLNIEKHTNTTFCDGETIDLVATFNTGNITWSTGAATPAIQVKNSGTYTATINTAAGCTVSKAIDVTFFPKPILNMPNATLCEFTNQQITLTAPDGFSSYMWNGQLGGRTYNTRSLGTVNLIVTDQNNCKASETINITSHCDNINLANTFTPNGDGVNDTWEISGINNDLKTTVTIFNRLGDVVFSSRGYPTPWNGEYQGKKLPMGTYYYIINTSGNKQILSGSITIIY